MLSVGAGVAFIEGLMRLCATRSQIPAYGPTTACSVWLRCPRVFKVYRAARVPRAQGRAGLLSGISANPSMFTVLLEDSAALLGLSIAFLGILDAQLLDDAASIGDR